MYQKKKHKLIVEEESINDTTTNSMPEVQGFSNVSNEKERNVCNVDLESEFKSSCGENNLTKLCNKFILKKEALERKCLQEMPDGENDNLYPNLNDINFNIKIAEKKEFNDTK